MSINNLPDDAISIHNLSKKFKNPDGKGFFYALDDVSLSIPRGSIFGLLGPNGAGKSTFINILAGLTIKTSGEAVVWGNDIDKYPKASRSSLGVVPQELTIDPFFTPKESLEQQAGLYGVRPKDRNIDYILRMLDLEDKSEAYSRTLSGGMRRRLLVAKAMVHRPPILILDEPTAGVDIELRVQLWDYVRKLNENGTTIILTTHYLEEAEELCDHVAILNHGEVMVSKTKSELLKSAGRKDLSVTIPKGQQNKALPDEIQSLNPIVTSSGFTVRFNPEETSSGDILKQIGNAGIQIIDVSTYQPDLEDIFLDLTR